MPGTTETGFTAEQLAQRVDMSVRNIREYQRLGLLAPPARRGRVGYYDDAHVARIERVRELRGEGFPLDLIRRILDAPGDAAPDVAALAAVVAQPFQDETPEPISRLKDEMPKVYDQLMGIREKLEQHYKEMQDIEFTVEEGTLYMLQTRTGKRTGTSAVRVAVEMVKEGMIDQATALKRVSPDSLNHLLLPQLDPKSKVKPVARGIAATGRVATRTRCPLDRASVSVDPTRASSGVVKTV